MTNISYNKITFTLMLLFCALFVNAQEEKPAGSVVDEIVAVVGGNIILGSEIENQYISYVQNGYSETSDMRCEILEGLLIQKMFVNQAELDSIEVTLKEVQDDINQRLKSFIDRLGDAKALEEYFGKSIEEMKEDLIEPTKQNLLAEKMQNELIGDVKATPADVKSFFNHIPNDSLPLINAEMEFEQIVIFPKISSKAKQETIEMMRKIRQDIIDGALFCTKAVLYSQDEGTASKCGEIGPFGRNDMVPEFSAVAFNLKEGELSNIVQTEFGYHLIKMIERRGELITVQHILRKAEISEQEVNNSRNKLDSIVKLIRIDTLTFPEAATKYSEDENSRNNGGLAVNPYTGTSKFEVDQLDPATYYALKKLKVGEISSIIETTDVMTGKIIYKVVRLRTSNKAHKANLNDDYQRLHELSIASKKQDIINKWVKKKLGSTFIRIDPSYKNCTFDIDGWVK